MKPTTKGVWAGIPGTNNYTCEIHKRPFFPPHMNFICVIACTWNPGPNALCGRFHAGSRSKINFVRRSWYKFEHCKSNNRKPGQNFYWGAHFSYEIRMCRVKDVISDETCENAVMSSKLQLLLLLLLIVQACILRLHPSTS